MLNKAIMKRAMCSHVGPCGPFWVMYLSTNQFCRFCGKIFHISGFQFCRFCDLSTNQFCRFCRAMCSHVGPWETCFGPIGEGSESDIAGTLVWEALKVLKTTWISMKVQVFKWQRIYLTLLVPPIVFVFCGEAFPIH